MKTIWGVYMFCYSQVLFFSGRIRIGFILFLENSHRFPRYVPHNMVKSSNWNLLNFLFNYVLMDIENT